MKRCRANAKVLLSLGCILLGLALWRPIFIGAASAGDSAGPTPAKMGIDSDGKMHIHRRDRCPLCAMLPVRYPEFSCAIELTDKRTFYFCSPRCLLRVWIDPKRYLNVPKAELNRIIVRHYFSGEQFDGKSAIWISGGHVIGPMGSAIVPLKTKKEVDAFKHRHGAKRVFHLKDLKPTDLKEILENP